MPELHNNFSEACTVPDGDSVLLTGGHCYNFKPNCTCTCGFVLTDGICDWGSSGCSRLASSKVHRYTQEQGWVEDLPDLTVGRYGHGCGAFTMNQEQVRDQRNSQLPFNLITFQIYLVAGGCGRWQLDIDNYGDEECIEYLASTEVYRGGRWITVEPLPVAVIGLRGASLDNTVYMTGESS